MLLKSLLCTLLSAAALVNAGFVDSKGKDLLHGSRYYIEECGEGKVRYWNINDKKEVYYSSGKFPIAVSLYSDKWIQPFAAMDGVWTPLKVKKDKGDQEILHFDGRGEPLFISGTRDEKTNCYELYQTKQNGDKVVDIRLAEHGHSNLQLGGNKWIASVRFLFASAY
ncbi:hypothetical protein K7432_006547 [Basidiobolus ranarum]|uniref:Uncharacterized protein n=1 Tax=Basidiobolus ranarum TaxID=34480 RepID=A0ABR2W1L8_9FUNG